ncbi:MAG TPA: hypothetical protein VHE30_17010 [Polyangiaceae bacterium]|nr:hypothetical protein [Polyangiaceae bacterium]
MTDAELTTFLNGAFVPYARGFAADPGAVRLAVVCTPYQVEATLTFAKADFDVIHQGAHTDVDIGRAFRVLVSWNDERAPSLEIVSG